MESMQQSKHDDISELLSLLEQAHQALARHWLGEDFVIELLLASVIAKGHVLVVDVPGVGKTTLAKSMAQILGLDFTFRTQDEHVARVPTNESAIPMGWSGSTVFFGEQAGRHGACRP